MRKIPDTLAAQQARFSKFVDKSSSPKGCWLWTGSKDHSGHGHIKMKMADGHFEFQAHRIAHIWWIGPIPDGLYVCHKRIDVCGNAACANPAHLYIGNSFDNFADAVADGRRRHNAALTEQQIGLIKAMYTANIVHGAISAIARRLNLSRATVSAVITGRIRNRI